MAANQDIERPASRTMYLECARRDGEALVQDGIQLQSLGRRLLKYTTVPGAMCGSVLTGSRGTRGHHLVLKEEP